MTNDVLELAAFASEPGGGNPAGLVLDASALTDAEMQSIAHDLAHPETAFLVEPVIGDDDRHARIRYFSPDAEVPFCGHATIATSVVLAERRGVGRFVLETQVGPIVVETVQGDDGLVTASFTSVEPTVRELDDSVADALLSILGLARSDLSERYPLRESFAGNRHPVVVVREQQTFDAFGYDPAALRTLMDEHGWSGTVTVVTPQDADGRVFEARNLFPVGDITEDPATGSAAAAFGAYLRAIGAVEPPVRITIHQGRHVGRPSVLLVDIPVSGGIAVSGTATPLA